VRTADRSFVVINSVVSTLALGFIAYILVVRQAAASASAVDLRFLPALNATLNATSAVLLASAWLAIRRKRVRLHRQLMVLAFAASALFLVSYLVYHWAHGDTRYQGEGAMRTVYFAILISHIVLSTVVLPAALTAFYLAWHRRFALHRRLMRVALPIWLYVSVTGVVIYFMLRGSTAAVVSSAAAPSP
jgi:putative membrane protein